MIHSPGRSGCHCVRHGAESCETLAVERGRGLCIITDRHCGLRGSRHLDLYEYQGKELLRHYDLETLPGVVAGTPEEAGRAAETLGGTVAIKAQVLTGGGGEAGRHTGGGGPREGGGGRT